jgi:hypothetical protein
MKATGKWYFASSGRELREVGQRFMPSTPQTVIEAGLGWSMPPSRMQDTAVNRGRSGQFPLGYPIPYVFKGHLTEPKAAVVNFVPKQS